MRDLQIDSELQAWIDPLTAEEYALLEASILQDGCRDPLVVWKGWLLDGHNRYEICSKHNIEFQTHEKTGLKTKADAKIWMTENQLGKRNVTDFNRAVLALKIKPLLEQRAKERMLAGKSDPVQNSAQGTGKTRDELAKVAGVSHDTVRKVEKILEKATPEVIEKVRSGETSINAAAKTVGIGKREPIAPTQELAGSKNWVTETLAKAQTATGAPDSTPADEEIQGARASDATIEVPHDELASLREENSELRISLKGALADNEMMGRVFDADDKLKAAMDEAKRQKAIAESAERTLAAKNGEYVERARAVTHWKNRAERAEKELAKLAKAAA